MPSPGDTSAGLRDARQRRTLIAVAAVVLIGAGLRAAAAAGDFWLDEIWSWTTAMRIGRASDILLRVYDENNHFLNTWLIHVLGPHDDWMIYRLPNVLAGVGSIVVAGLVGRRNGTTVSSSPSLPRKDAIFRGAKDDVGQSEPRPTAEALANMALVAGSYLLVHYSSEARGYGLAVFFALLAFLALQRALDRPSLRWELTFAAACLLGVLSQPVFVYAYGSFSAWWLWRALRELRGMNSSRGKTEAKAHPDAGGAAKHRPSATPPDAEPRRLSRWLVAGLRCHAAPIAFMAWLYVANLRRMVNAGGPVIPLFDVIAQTLSLAAGGPWGGAGAVVVAAAAALAAMAGIALLYRRRDDLWVFYACVLFLMPGGLMLVTQRSEVYPRYFVIGVAFLCLLAGRLFAAAWASGRHGQVLAGVLLAAVLVGNGFHVARLIRLGRGRYLQALDAIQVETTGSTLSLGSDHDFRNPMLLAFYQPYLNKRIDYHKNGQWTRRDPEWLLLHALDLDARFQDEFVSPQGVRYRLIHTYPYAGLSGSHWGVYRRM